MGICMNLPDDSHYIKIPFRITLCYFCKKTVRTSLLAYTCKHCQTVIGHHSCIKYRLLITPVCPYCAGVLTK